MKLQIELVPEHCENNLRTLMKKEWPAISKQVRSVNTCEICGASQFLKNGKPRKFEAHEIWYYDDIKHIQSLIGIRSVCKICHMVHHLCHTQVKLGLKYFNLAIMHFCRINNLDLIHFENYFKHELEIWTIRGQNQWTTDISWINDFSNKENHA